MASTDSAEVNYTLLSQGTIPHLPSSPNSILNTNNIEDEIKLHPLNSYLYGSKGFHICHLNVRSLLNKIDEIKNLLKNETIQVFTISESWLNETIKDEEIKIKGYNTIRQDRGYKINKKSKKNKRSGGLIMYIRDDIPIDTVTLKHLNINTVDIEAHWVICKFKTLGNIIIGNSYRPPRGSITNFINYVLDLSTHLKNYNKVETYLLGDNNICLSENSVSAKLLVDSMKLCNMNQIIKCNTRLGCTKKSLLDHIFTNSKHVINSGVGPVNISDHLLIMATRKNSNNLRNKTCILGRKIKRCNMDSFKQNILDHDWSFINGNTDCNSIWDNIEKAVVIYADTYFPNEKIVKK